MIPSSFNLGYQDENNAIVMRVNAQPVDTLSDVEAALQHPEGEFHVIDLAPPALPRQIVLDAAGLEKATNEILEVYKIPSAARSRERPLPDGGPDCPGTY